MSNPKASAEAKIVDAVMEELRELEPVSQVLDGLHEEQDVGLRACLGDRVHEIVEPYRTSERALRDIVKSLAEQNGQTPVRAEVVFGEKSAAVTVSMPTLTPEREAHFAQSICSTIGGLLGLAIGKVKSFGTDAEDASPGDQREPPGREAAPSGGQRPPTTSENSVSVAGVAQGAGEVGGRVQAPPPQTLDQKIAILESGGDVEFVYAGEERVARSSGVRIVGKKPLLSTTHGEEFWIDRMQNVRVARAAHDVGKSGMAQPALVAAQTDAEKERILASCRTAWFVYEGSSHHVRVSHLWSKDGVLWLTTSEQDYDVSKLTCVQPGVSVADGPQTYSEKLELLKPETDVSFWYRGEEHKARVLRVVRRSLLHDLHTVDGSVYDVKAISDVRPVSSCAPATSIPESDALVLRLLLGNGKLPGTGVRFMYCGQQQDFDAGWTRKVYFDTEIGQWAVLFSNPRVPTSSFRVSDIREITSYPDERLCEIPKAFGAGSVIETAVSKAFGPAKRRNEYPEIGEKHEFPVLEVAEYLHGHATGSGGGLDQETAQKWAEWLRWRTEAGWTESLPISSSYDSDVRSLARSAIDMFYADGAVAAPTQTTLEKLETILGGSAFVAFTYDEKDHFVGVRRAGRTRSGWMMFGGDREEEFLIDRMQNIRGVAGVGG